MFVEREDDGDGGLSSRTGCIGVVVICVLVVLTMVGSCSVQSASSLIKRSSSACKASSSNVSTEMEEERV